jgi:UDP-2-acetamido-3-amino-2,3-dideoxy-glucuronate N-acetyltransferase
MKSRPSTVAPPPIAVIGAGYWGRNLVRNFHDLGALRWVCDASAATLQSIADRYPDVSCTSKVHDVLMNPEVAGVVIATPAETHASLVRRALEAGKDVLVEKPLCLDIEEGKELVALAERNSRILMVGHLLWYHPAVLKLRDMICSGELGRIQYIYSNRVNLGRIRREENILWSFAPHDVSVILGLLGEMPDSVQAQGGNYLHEKIADVTVSLLSFPSGVRAHVFVSWLHPFKEQKLVVVGDRKMAVFDDVQPETKLVLYPHAIDWRDHVPVATHAKAEPVLLDKAEPLRAECSHFLECLGTRRQPRTDGHEALRVLSVLQRCEEALQDSAMRPRSTAGNGQKTVRVEERSDTVNGPRYFAHESAFIDPGVVIGDGTSIWHVSHVMKGSTIGNDCRIGQNVVIGPNATIGDGVKIQNNVSVYEGITLEDHVFCGPSIVFTNVYNPRSEIRRMDELRKTLVRRGATLGANCTILCGVTIGAYAFVAAGAVVIRDVPDYALVVGNPGRVAGWMCACGNRIRFGAGDGAGSCEACSARYRKADAKVWPE